MVHYNCPYAYKGKAKGTFWWNTAVAIAETDCRQIGRGSKMANGTRVGRQWSLWQSKTRTMKNHEVQRCPSPAPTSIYAIASVNLLSLHLGLTTLVFGGRLFSHPLSQYQTPRSESHYSIRIQPSPVKTRPSCQSEKGGLSQLLSMLGPGDVKMVDSLGRRVNWRPS